MEEEEEEENEVISYSGGEAYIGKRHKRPVS